MATETPTEQPRRGRPREFDRAAAVAAATRLFWERGYEAASIGELAQAMGIRSGSLYAAFGDKQSLFKEAVAAYGDSPYGAFVNQAFAQETTAYGAIARMLREAARIFPDPSHPAGCMMISAATNISPMNAEVQEYLRKLRADNVAAMESRLAQARSVGELPAGADPHALAEYFAAVFQGMSQRARDGADAEELAAVAELALMAWPGQRP